MSEKAIYNQDSNILLIKDQVKKINIDTALRDDNDFKRREKSQEEKKQREIYLTNKYAEKFDKIIGELLKLKVYDLRLEIKNLNQITDIFNKDQKIRSEELEYLKLLESKYNNCICCNSRGDEDICISCCCPCFVLLQCFYCCHRTERRIEIVQALRSLE